MYVYMCVHMCTHVHMFWDTVEKIGRRLPLGGSRRAAFTSLASLGKWVTSLDSRLPRPGFLESWPGVLLPVALRLQPAHVKACLCTSILGMQCDHTPGCEELHGDWPASHLPPTHSPETSHQSETSWNQCCCSQGAPWHGSGPTV